MGYSFTYFAVSMALAILSRLIDAIEWKNKKEELWLVISRLILVLALILSVKALCDIIRIGPLYWYCKPFGS